MTTLTVTPYHDLPGFERAVERERATLAAYARRLVRNSADAEDLVQETLLRAYRHRETLAGSGRLGAWLFVTLRNLFINQLRQRKRQPTLLSVDEGNLPEIADASPDPARAAVGRLERRALERALAALPDAYRVPLLRADRDGLTYGEIADELGLPIGTVRSRIFRARARLRRSLYGWLVGERSQ
jgi:RNA polymerase sigma-70 factor, ECF subfamily